MAIFESQNETIYVDLDDEVTTIFARIRATRAKNIALVVPARAQILQSLVSLKILRFKSEHAGKNLTIATKDSAGRRLAEGVGDSRGRKFALEKFPAEKKSRAGRFASAENFAQKI